MMDETPGVERRVVPHGRGRTLMSFVRIDARLNEDRRF
jgi:hypothetical protein